MADIAYTVFISKIFAALGSCTRIALVRRLSAAETFGGQSISELAAGTGLTRQSITKHLEVLADAGLVSRMKPGRATYYDLKSEPFEQAIDLLALMVMQRARSKQNLDEINGRIFRRTDLR